MSRQQRGTTLLELIVTILILLILAGLSAAGYLYLAENSRADAARVTVQLVAHANRMQALDGLTKSPITQYLPAPGKDGRIRVPDAPCGPPWDGGALTRCRYLRATDWDAQAYVYRACRQGEGGGCCKNCGPDAIACARRRPGSSLCSSEPPAAQTSSGAVVGAMPPVETVAPPPARQRRRLAPLLRVALLHRRQRPHHRIERRAVSAARQNGL